MRSTQQALVVKGENKRPFRFVDYNSATGSKGVFVHLKQGDASVLAKQLKAVKLIQHALANKQALSVLDVGGDNGWMLFCLLHLLASKAVVHILEPSDNVKKLPVYQQAISLSQARSAGISHVGLEESKIPYKDLHITEVNTVSLESITRLKVQDYAFTPPKVSLTLFSHAAYYVQKDLVATLYKLLGSLTEGGALAVVVQSTDGTNQLSLAGKKLFNHEEFEDHIYPIIKGITHSDNPYYANARMLELALNKLQKKYVALYGKEPDWNVQTDYSVTEVPLGRVNSKVSAEGCYIQDPDTESKLQFYLRGKSFSSLTPDGQGYVVNILKNHCQNKEGQFVMCHVNKVYTIVPGREMTRNLQGAYQEASTSLVARL